MILYKLARQDNPYHNDPSRDTNESHGKSVILLGRFSSTDPNNAIEVARLIFGIDDENGVQVHLLSERSRRSLNWGRILLCEFTDHWFSVMCGAADKPLEKKDLESLGRRFWNTMVSIHGKEEWVKNRETKAEELWAWLAARTTKLNLRSEISKVSISVYNELTLYHSLHGVHNQETRLSQNRSKFTKVLLENGNSDIEKKRRVFLSKARSAISNVVLNAHAGDGYSSCLTAANTILLEYGTSREIWLEKCLLDIPTKALFRLAKIYFRPTETKTEGSAREAEKVLGELDKKQLETQPKKRDALRKKWEKLIYGYGTLERYLRTCEVLLPAFRPGESAREIPRTSQTGSKTRGLSHGNHCSSSMAAAPTRKQLKDVTRNSSANPGTSTRNHSQDITPRSSSTSTSHSRTHSQDSNPASKKKGGIKNLIPSLRGKTSARSADRQPLL
ncbi:hypothetical protein OCU04_002235 [Sclerotinia nivalis]|uniref:Uncharacterized protein n=1 Tax=Sclerotinia nivalis TaxID=352851 RepID=A0A9X0AZQ5_9HELO|nr:hypothetical protein OCU04_002235 [Sclerotinia nivalis]